MTWLVGYGILAVLVALTTMVVLAVRTPPSKLSDFEDVFSSVVFSMLAGAGWPIFVCMVGMVWLNATVRKTLEQKSC